MEGRQRILDVESLIVLQDNVAPVEGSEPNPFWKSQSLDELAQEQGVAPAGDLDEISDLWPVDEDRKSVV